MTSAKLFSHSSVGRYIVALAGFQCVLYVALTVWPGTDWLLTLEPRMGLFAAEATMHAEDQIPGVLRWLSVVAVGACGFAVLRRRGLGAYLWVEGTLSVPQLLFAAAVMMSGLAPQDGFSLMELTPTVLVFLVFSALPFAAVLRLWRLRLQ